MQSKHLWIRKRPCKERRKLLGGSGNLVSAAFCDFSNYKCTTEKKEATSFPPKIRQVSDPGESEKPKVWLLISLQKSENRDYVRASAWVWMFLFVIYTSEMLVPLISLSGVAWMILMVKYSHWRKWLDALIMICWFCFYVKIESSDSSFIMSAININISAWWWRIKQLTQEFNEAVLSFLDNASRCST